METQEPRSGMREALHTTTDTINSRIKRFKILVISVAIVTLGSLIWAIVWMSWFPLLVLILNKPICGAFFISEILILNRWQSQILELWISDLLNLDVYSDAMTKIRMFPQNTLRSMLATLPESNLADNTPANIKKSLAMTLQTINHCQTDRIVFNILAITFGLVSLICVLVIHSLIPLSGLLLIPVTFGIGRIIRSVRLRKWKRNIDNINQQQKMDITMFSEIANKLDWGVIQKKKEVLKEWE
ncbi:MAG: hypothetical protein QG641_405 [Candidatus Poribacteria bacterium]|nr:hypothetical protein [Candidatus Poribacteria bacterium]